MTNILLLLVQTLCLCGLQILPEFSLIIKASLVWWILYQKLRLYHLWNWYSCQHVSLKDLKVKVVHCCNIYFYGYHIIGSVYWCLCFLCGIESFSITKGIYFRGWVISLLCIVESANIVVIIVVYLLGLLRYSLIAYDFSILTD